MHSIIILLVTLSFSATDETDYHLNDSSFKSGRLPTSHLQKFHHYGLEESSSYSFSQADTFIFWEEDYENGANGWIYDSGWEHSTDKPYGGNYSAFSPDIEIKQDANLISPVILLPSLSTGETIHFGFWLYTDMPDSNSDNDTILDDYYKVSIIDTTDSYWHSTTLNSEDGNSFWCGDAELGGYDKRWIQFLDTPSIPIPDSSSILSARIFYNIEEFAGATMDDLCVDGWDAANIRISSDNGTSWELLADSSYIYNFNCGYGWIRNDSEYDVGGSLNHLAKGWGGDSNGWQDFNADLSGYAGKNIIIRFAFGSDAAYSTSENNALTGFQVDAISVSDTSAIHFSDNGDNMHQMTIITEVWNDLFYDYGGESRPGTSGWEFYSSGKPENGNIELDISEYSEKLIKMKIQTQYDANVDAPDSLGEGLYIDNFTIYTQCILDENACDCDGNVDAGCGCSEAGPSGCDNACGSTAVVDECGVCDGSGPQITCQDGSTVCEMVDCPMISQTIVLSSGWNIISFYNEPLEMSLVNIVQPLIDSGVLLKVQNELGDAIVELPIPIGWVDGIGEMEVSEGYYIKVTENSDISITGQSVTLPFTIPLNAGWNILGYPLTNSQQAMDVFQPLIDSGVLLKVQNELGDAIVELPIIGWVDGIIDLEPGEGYYIKVNIATDLILND